MNVNPNGFLWACCAGIAVGSAEMLSFCVSGMGVDATKSSTCDGQSIPLFYLSLKLTRTLTPSLFSPKVPIIIGGSIMMGAILGLVMLGETLLLQGWAGVAILMLGIGMVATDPGEKVQGH